ncbi:MAG: hypothetical protein ACLT29_05365 [Ruminococcus callidus]
MNGLICLLVFCLLAVTALAALGCAGGCFPMNCRNIWRLLHSWKARRNGNGSVPHWLPS